MSRAPSPLVSQNRRSKADKLRIARMRLHACKEVIKVGQQLRPHVDAMRLECADKGDLAGVEAVEVVSATVARWEDYGRKVARWERVIAGLRGTP